MLRIISSLFLIILLVVVVVLMGFFLGGNGGLDLSGEVVGGSFGDNNGFGVDSLQSFLIVDDFNEDDGEFDDDDFNEQNDNGGSNRPEVFGDLECSSDLECDSDFYSDNYCLFDFVYRDLHDFSCDGNGECGEDVTEELLVECEFGCEGGTCVTIFASDCYENIDCGINDFIGEKFCDGNKIYQNYRSWSCVEPDTADSLCRADLEIRLIEECDPLTCVDGECV